MTALPKALEGIQDADIDFIEFELCDPDESDDDIEAWLGALPSDGNRFIVFARDGTGSLFCVWLRPGQDELDAAPIVFLGSEGGLATLAQNADSFLDYVVAGLSFSAYGDEFFDPLEDEEDEEELESERGRRAKASAWVEARTGRNTHRSPRELRDEAKGLDPDLKRCIEANNAHT